MKTDLPALPSLQGATRLADWGVIRAVGEDARTFLQGQLTQDVLQLEAHQARLAGFCSAKGRLMASFVVWRGGPDELLLACSADLLAATLKRLSMFVLRAKCKLSDASGELALWGLAGDAATKIFEGNVPPSAWTRGNIAGAAAIRLPDALVGSALVPRFLYAVGTGSADLGLPELNAASWRWLEVMSGTARICAATSEKFVPQMVNLELVGGVNFQKGCYPGQEIVARSQYRGTLKRRAFVVHSESALRLGQEVFHSADETQPCGMVALAGQAGQHHAALVELKIAATISGELHAGAADGPLLELGTLPYLFPAETA